MKKSFFLFLAAIGISTTAFTTVLAQDKPAAGWQVVVLPSNSWTLQFIYNGKPALEWVANGWGPKWAWVKFGSQVPTTPEGLDVSDTFAINAAEGQVFDVSCSVRKTGEKEMTFVYKFSAKQDVDLHIFAAMLKVVKNVSEGGKLMAGSTEVDFASKRFAGMEAAKDYTLTLPSAGGDVVISFDTPIVLSADGVYRFSMLRDKLTAGETTVTAKVRFPSAVDFLCDPARAGSLIVRQHGDDWFPFDAEANKIEGSVIGFEDWLEKPAGKRGGVREKGEGFIFEDGSPIKFWGVNLSYAMCAPEKDLATYTAARFAKFGVNAVRLHKFTGPNGWAGIADKNDSTKMTEDGMERLDFFANEMTKNGVYYGFSHTFGFRISPGLQDRLFDYDELMGTPRTKGNKKPNAMSYGNTYALINWAEDVQDLLIETVVNLLNHSNPHTGKRYADDPALCYVELQNEDDIFFYSTEKALKDYPNYAKRFQGQFAVWLKEKYGDDAALKTAWEEALRPAKEGIDKGLVEFTSVASMNPQSLEEATPGRRQRILDCAAFFHYTQNKFYTKFVKAIRETGYKGPLCGSPWKAVPGLPHYYNLKSDYDVGFIDRHFYQKATLPNPGEGIFSIAFQQVSDRPFVLSEWIQSPGFPSAYSSDGPAVAAVYGFGLQGWDGSYEFQNKPILTLFDNNKKNAWNCEVPSQIGQYPSLARMIMRGDVKEGAVVASRNISPENLATGKFNFPDIIVMKNVDGDSGEAVGDINLKKAIVAGRVVINFVDKETPSTIEDIASKYEKDGIITSNTGQLAWCHEDEGYFTVDTDGTKALVGFAQGKPQSLGGWTLALKNPYVSFFLTAREKGKTLADAPSAIITAIGRSSFTGFTRSLVDNRVLVRGDLPELYEPVQITTTSPRPIASVNVLDHAGFRTGKTLPLTDGKSFSIDGTADKTFYYEIIFQ